MVPAANVVPAPRDGLPLDDAQLASIPTVFMTAWQMLVDRAAIRQGETVLVLAGRLGRRRGGDPDRQAVGARVIATASTAAKLAAARALGADDTIDHTTDDIVAEVKRLTGRRGVDIVIDHVGAATFAQVGAGGGARRAHRGLRRDRGLRAGR